MLFLTQHFNVSSFSQDPFAGMLSPAHIGGNILEGKDGNKIAQLFSVKDVEHLVQAACSSNVPAHTIAQALSQLAQIASDKRFCHILGEGQGGFSNSLPF